MGELDISALRTAVLDPRGLGSREERRQLWYRLLGVPPPPAPGPSASAVTSRELSPDQASSLVTSPTATSGSDESRLSLRGGIGVGVPAIQFGTVTGSDSAASSSYTDSVGEPDSALESASGSGSGSGSATTESQHAFGSASEQQLKPPSLGLAPAADEWQTVSKRRRPGSHTPSQLDHGEEPRSASPSTQLPSMGATEASSLGQDTSASGSGISSATSRPGMNESRSVNRFDALQNAPSSKPSSPARSEGRAQARRRSRAGSRAREASSSVDRSSQSTGNGPEAGVTQAGMSGTPATPSRTSLDRLTELLHQGDDLPARDAQQVELDVNRSFLNFRKGSLKDPAVLAARRRQLSSLCTGVLKRRRALSYYQGYHDVLTVLLLTLLPDVEKQDSSTAVPTIPPELHLAAERLSLHWLRDAMTRNLDAVMGHLRLLRSLLRQADPELAGIVERAFPLPYFALPWVITLLTHSLPSLALAQRVLDFVLVYGPLSAVYLAASIIRLNKDAVLAAQAGKTDEDDVDAEIRTHQTLAALPAFKLDDEAAALLESSDPEQEQTKHTGYDQFADAVGDDSVYDDPDVFGPADSSFGPRDDSNDARDGKHGDATSRRPTASGIPISSLLRHTADLMARFNVNVDSSYASGSSLADIMGAGSVLRTWPTAVAVLQAANDGSTGLTLDREGSAEPRNAAGWDKIDGRAEYIVRVDSGETLPDGPEPADALVIVHPEPAPGLDSDDEGTTVSLDEKGSEKRLRRPGRTGLRTTSVRAFHKRDPSSLAVKTTTATIAVLGVAGVLLGMYAASNGGASIEGLVAASSSSDRAEQAREVLAVLARWMSLMH